MKASIEKFGEKFLHRVFTEKEIEYCESRKMTKYESYAARFAGKEAVYKAISPDRNQGGVFTEVEILNEESGRPYVAFHGELAKVAEKMHAEVSLSHEKEYAIATAIVFNKIGKGE
ncbi:MAG: holo-ACP synthase [Clostridia bacterium]|nr:holo-ACP synthase [Clostridia bacterium]